MILLALTNWADSLVSLDQVSVWERHRGTAPVDPRALGELPPRRPEAEREKPKDDQRKPPPSGFLVTPCQHDRVVHVSLDGQLVVLERVSHAPLEERRRVTPMSGLATPPSTTVLNTRSKSPKMRAKQNFSSSIGTGKE
jgi:hypothetical protein